MTTLENTEVPAAPSPFEPLKLGPITLRNRFIKSGANEGMCLQGRPTAALVNHHRELAAGGVGMTTVAYLAVASVGRTLPNQTWMRPEIVPDLRVLTDAVHAEGGAISAQITHGGSFVTGMHVRGRLISASSGFNPAGLMKANFLQRKMNQADMDRVTAEFVEAAKLAREAGFDAVEIHMGHGYLLNQFISPMSNKRTDEYGGSAENRVRFPARVLAAVREAVGDDVAVLAKINVADGPSRGATVEDAIVTARALQQAGAHMLVLSGGRNVESTWFMFGSNMNREEIMKVMKLTGDWLSALMMKVAAFSERKIDFREMYFREYSQKIRAAVDLPLAYLGGVKSLDNVETAMADGFETVVLARALLRDPDLVAQFQGGQMRQSRCDNCNACVAYIYHPDGTRCIHRDANDPQANRIFAADAG
ncbi:NADH:flavin oxidoreductase [Seongchinamella sediminis]|uniref:NADH:flavin oxidoreductase n=1 Tax=Seongchinamella sediminis TaxID=2283635 RepID=A0A3L7E075_9GAMM|nr:NADH:flavin oxidoreductase [Seongchinamella sediminis]RLQ22914.1 NADH:flavin oxidoreductase [Seongchinamella sediminis]